MIPRSIVKLSVLLALAGGVSGCQTAVGVSYGYGYSDPFYWNHYYSRDVDIDVNLPDRPPAAKPKPPIAKPPAVRPPTHRPARPSRPSGGGRLR